MHSEMVGKVKTRKRSHPSERQQMELSHMMCFLLRADIVAGIGHFPLTLLQSSVPHCSLGSSLLSLDVHGLWCVGFFLASTDASGNGFGRGDFGEGNQNQCQVCPGSLTL